jgi:integrase
VDGAIIVPAQEKTDLGRGVTELVFREADERALSAAYYYSLGVKRAHALGCDTALFCSDRGDPYISADVIGKSLVELLNDMGIDGYTGYSFRHALIQALFDAGLDEKQVNAYTGHSNASHTAITWYYHLDKHWAGQKIRALSADALRVIANDEDE